MTVQFILLLDDDTAFRAELAEQIEDGGGFRVTTAGTIAEAYAQAMAEDAGFDAMLLDVTLPDGDGRDLCARLRRAGLAMPILMLTGSNDEADVVHGLEAGADDYVAKPFPLGVLLARLRTQLRPWENRVDAVLPIAAYGFQPSTKSLRDASGKRHALLTVKETEILRYLHRKSGQAVNRKDLLGEVWGYAPGISTHTVETHVYRLRRKLEQDPTKPRILITQGHGYRLDPHG
ncbi:MAG: response regulator transcription factor [Janthinobacterium lividum]